MSPQIPPRQHAEVSQNLFMIIVWIFTSVSLVFVLARIGIKLGTFRRLFWDDVLVVLAWAMLLTVAILWKYNIHFLYENYEIVQGKRPFDQTAIDNWDTFMRLVVPANVLFYSSLWAVKLSFLLFFRKFGNQLRSYQIYWWVVLALTIIAYIGCIADIQYECTVPAKPVLWVMQNCASQDRIDWVNRTFYANCSVDVITDILILSIPVIILWNAGVSVQKRIILCGIFSATVAIMVVAIIRVTVVNSRHQNAEIGWLYFWTFVENGTAIMIACVASFRQLFVASQDEQTGSYSKQSGSSFLRFFQSSKSSTDSEKSGDKWDSTRPKTVESSDNKRDGSEEHIYPIEFVTIHNTLDAPSNQGTHGH